MLILSRRSPHSRSRVRSATPALALLGALCAADCVVAQGIDTLPAGYLGVAGQSSTSFPFSAGETRYQEIHTTHRNVPMPGIHALSFRRDEQQSPLTGAVARTAMIEVRMGHGNASNFGSVFDDNYSLPPTTVFLAKPVNLPDAVLPQGTGGQVSEPWTIRLPFDQTFSYSGTEDLVWELHYSQASATGSYRVDRTVASANPLYTSSSGTDLGSGCLVPGRSSNYDLSATLFAHYSGGLNRLRVSSRFGPGNSPVFLHIGFQNPQGMVGFLCEEVLATADITLPVGMSSSSGSTSSEYFTFPFAPSTLNHPLYLQAWSINPNQIGNVSITQGVEINGPTPPANLPDFAYLEAPDLTRDRGDGPFHTGAIVTRIEW